MFHHPVWERESVPKAEFIVEEHRGEGSTDELLEHLRLLVDKRLADQGWMDTFIHRDFGDFSQTMLLLGLAGVDVGAFGPALGPITTDRRTPRLITLLESRALVVELHGTLVSRTAHPVFATLHALWTSLVTLFRRQLDRYIEITRGNPPQHVAADIEDTPCYEELRPLSRGLTHLQVAVMTGLRVRLSRLLAPVARRQYRFLHVTHGDALSNKQGLSLAR